MNILITGARGQLGLELINQLSQNSNYNLLLTDLEQLDITNSVNVIEYFESFNPHLVINCAAYTAVDKCETDIDNAYKVNAIGPRNLSIASAKVGAAIVHISTDYVFDGEGIAGEDGLLVPYNEFDLPNPQTVYGKTKWQGEKFVQAFNPKHFIIRTAWLYGEGNNFVRTMINLSKNHSSLKVVNDQTGSPTSTKELAKMILHLINTESYGLYHGTCEGMCTWYEFTKEIFRLKGIDAQVIPCTSKEYPRPAKRPKWSVLDNYMLKLTSDFKFAHWKDAIKQYLDKEE